jgi:hypothetical protein
VSERVHLAAGAATAADRRVHHYCNVVSEGVHLAAGAATAADRKGCSFIAVQCCE